MDARDGGARDGHGSGTEAAVVVDVITGFSKLRIEQDDRSGRWWVLTAPLVFRAEMADWNGCSGDPARGDLRLTVPVDFRTDLASIPRWMTWICPWVGPYNQAAVAHDYLYSRRVNRFLADSLFRVFMERLGVPRWQRVSMYLAVRAFGWIHYRRKEG